MGVRISEAPEPLKILLIDTTHVEIYWNQELVLNGGMTSAYHILYKGQELPLHEVPYMNRKRSGQPYP